MLKHNVASILATRACQMGLVIGSFAGVAGFTAPAQAIGDPCQTALVACYRQYGDDPEMYQFCVDEAKSGICDTSGDPVSPPIHPNCGNLNEWPCLIEPQ